MFLAEELDEVQEYWNKISALYDGITNEVVRYILTIITVIGAVIIGVLIVYGKMKRMINDASTGLSSVTEETSKGIEENRELRKKLKDMEERQDLIIKQNEEILKQNAKFSNFPRAFATYVNSKQQAVESGIAKEVNDILEVGDE